MSSKNTETRKRIFAATLQLLEGGRGNKVRMSDIAKAAKVSRQAVYLHFPNRAELLTATARYLDDVYNIEQKLAASRNAATGLERLEEWVLVWGNYIPKIYGMAKALLAMKDYDLEAAAAWNDRMQAVRHGCEAAVKALKSDGILSGDFTTREATDFLWTLQSVRVWEQLTRECGWSQKRYIAHITRIAKQTLVA